MCVCICVRAYVHMYERIYVPSNATSGLAVHRGPHRSNDTQRIDGRYGALPERLVRSRSALPNATSERGTRPANDRSTHPRNGEPTPQAGASGGRSARSTPSNQMAHTAATNTGTTGEGTDGGTITATHARSPTPGLSRGATGLAGTRARGHPRQLRKPPAHATSATGSNGPSRTIPCSTR